MLVEWKLGWFFWGSITIYIYFEWVKNLGDVQSWKHYLEQNGEIP